MAPKRQSACVVEQQPTILSRGEDGAPWWCLLQHPGSWSPWFFESSQFKNIQEIFAIIVTGGLYVIKIPKFT
jgi:hypothetical protein